ncbi:MAG: redoxin domain-containing protein [Bacteroides sp.]|nr:redoxin domain-containing protein [Roseburia sp.]MCM1345511.1 redoxin domain-containing protein [Bacteroides sp.]MCM1420020.1 redoxin domain-containing protein [Bacteroides sp.]
MKKAIAIISAALAVCACDKGPQFIVEGNISDAKDSLLYMEAQTLEGVVRLDSTKLKEEGTFKFSVPAPSNPEFYSLRIGRKHIHFSIDSTETLKITAQYPTMTTNYKVEGSDNAQKIKEIHVLQQDLQSKIIAIEQNKSMYPGDKTDSIKYLVDAYKTKMKNDYIFKDPSKTYAYYAVCQSITDLAGTFMLFDPFTNRDDVKCYAAVATAWDGQYPNAARTEQICNAAIKGMGNTAQPTQKVIELDESKIVETGIIDVNLPDINNKMKSIKDLKGKVVLLDFTLYGAKESAQRTRLMRDLYEKYKSQGLEIYQVSLDEDIHFWKFSVENLPWICVHETDGRTVRSYGVSQLPTFFIINRNNEVVKRSDFVENIEEEIKSLI